ncbi:MULTISPECIES: hypothetical protein [Halorussus]|uniref:hypothetical protein n=1 Tax=Halorussus TaxID=1070314 RepID=UPI000E213526|nr:MULTISPECIES: hypothetical protein [Halorussus]NHN59806.1 hypothetical protein [Halorussus sp. JP-T4]
MDDINQHALEEISHTGGSISTERILFLIEYYDSDGEPGIPRDRYDRYAEAIEANDRVPYTAEEMRAVIDSRLTDSRTWVPHAFYQIAPNRISLFPARWHDKLDGETDVREHVRYIQSADSGFHGDDGNLHTAGVPKQLLIRAVSVFGGEDPETVKEQLDNHIRNGDLRALPDQNPNADIQLQE